MDRASNGNYTKQQTAARDTARSLPPPPPDESYWAALLQEDERFPSPAARHARDWEHGNGMLAESGERNTEQSRADWQAIEQVYRADQVVTLPVVGYNRGGLLVEWRSLRGFVPASQLVDFPAVSDGAARRNELALRVGQLLRLRVIELDYEQNRLILSERAAQVQAGARANILDTLRSGDICQGQVTNLCDFGAFVDLGGVEGLIHISELSWGRVGHPRDILTRDLGLFDLALELKPLDQPTTYRMLVNYLNSARPQHARRDPDDPLAVHPFTPETARLLCERSDGVPRYLNRLGSYVLLKAATLRAELITPDILEQGFKYADQQLRGQTGLTPEDQYVLDLVLEKGILSDETVTLADLERLKAKEFSEILPILDKLVQLDLLRRLPSERAGEYAPTPLVLVGKPAEHKRE